MSDGPREAEIRAIPTGLPEPEPGKEQTMSTTPTAAPTAATTPPGRKITDGEIQRLVNDSWVAMNIRLSPGKVSTTSCNRIQVYARQNFLPQMEQARDLIFVNYKDAVRLIADAYYRSVLALRFEPNALEWTVEHPSVTKRRELELQNRGLAPVEPTDVPDYAQKEQEFADKVKAEKAHRAALGQIEAAIAGVCFTNIRGVDHRKTEELQTELRDYVSKNLGKKNGADVLGWVQAKIAWAYKNHEKQQELWNSR